MLTFARAASKSKTIRRGVKEVVKAVRKGEKGVCVIAGDISPIDVISHLPVLCEDNEVPYVFVPSKEALGTAGQTKRPTSCVLIKKGGDGDQKEKYDEVSKKVKEMQVT
jgi:H/ACA ribonucleoprotein complex subunit 2